MKTKVKLFTGKRENELKIKAMTFHVCTQWISYCRTSVLYLDELKIIMTIVVASDVPAVTAISLTNKKK